MKPHKPRTKTLDEILNEIRTRAIEHGYDDLHYTEAEIILWDKNRTKIRKRLPPKWFAKPSTNEPPDSVKDRLSQLEIYVSDINYKLLLILDILNIDYKKEPPEENEEEEPDA